MRKPLEGKIAIITGGGRGLGRAMALGYAEAGIKGLVITAAKNFNQIENVARVINNINGKLNVQAYKSDVTDRSACQEVVNKIIAIPQLPTVS